jgi:protein SCO1/2
MGSRSVALSVYCCGGIIGPSAGGLAMELSFPVGLPGLWSAAAAVTLAGVLLAPTQAMPQAAGAAATAAAFRLAAWPAGAAPPDFVLIDTQRKRRTLADYRGRVLVVFFGFTHCPEACSAELFKLSTVMEQLGPLRARVRVLFITLDPERDTVPVLQRYVSGFDRQFIGLTGSPAQVDRAAASFSVEYAKVPMGDDYTISHSTGAYVFDKRGRLRLIGAMQTSAVDFTHDLSALARE